MPARVLPMCDEPVRTRVRARDTWLGVQEYLIRERTPEPVQDVEFAGADAARPTAQVLEAIAAAEAIVIGPSNPILSIGPILAVPGLRDALAAAAAPVVGVSPIVRGEVVKGPTRAFLAWAGVEPTGAGVAGHYGDLLDGWVCDERFDDPGVPLLVTDTDMAQPAARARLAAEVLDFARSLA